MKFATAVLAAIAALGAAAERQPLERYQSIIDRQMFGALPSDFDPSKLPSEVQKSSRSEKELTAEQEKLRSAIHFSVINVRSDGRVEVGFTDNTDPKEPRHYFICEGDTAGGWTVEEADHETATMTISKDGVSLELRLGDNSAKGGGSMKRSGEASGTGTRNSPLLNTGGFTSLRRRRAEQEEEDRKRREEEEKRRVKEREAEEEREAQREEEREEQRKQLLAIQEELRRVREAKAESKEAKGADNDSE
jgi:hypothetical protein